MDFVDLKRHWDAFGRIDPFWAILTDPSRRGNKWDPEEFFATGREEVRALFERAASLGVPGRRARALDFGCGAGRLTQAMTSYVDEATGVDVAPSMIELARRHNPHGARCRYEVNERPDLSLFRDGMFDVVYTGRVLQHMEPRFAEAYMREFVRVLAPGGFLSFDVPSEHGFFPPDGGPRTQPGTGYRATLRFVSCPTALLPGESAALVLEVTNDALDPWLHGELNVGNHWARLDGSAAVFDDGRTPVALPWSAGEQRVVTVQLHAPAEPGRYRLQCDVVHEGVTWFAEAGSSLVETEVTVGRIEASPPAEAAAPTPDEPAMEMHAVKRDRVERLLIDAGARLLDVRRTYHCGPTWLAFRYDVTR